MNNIIISYCVFMYLKVLKSGIDILVINQFLIVK